MNFCLVVQSVKVAGKVSNLQVVTSGVPHNSVLGPVLFLIYVNCISNIVTVVGKHPLMILNYISVFLVVLVFQYCME